ncbi:MAG: 6-phosphofructo-2-kinase/fructose-2,6-bisphosphatase [Myxococcota bacterium]|nr:6-phosphofructo-2-kinase/fructose-2,6-bisphosphatase [Myxococcota bacterium]
MSDPASGWSPASSPGLAMPASSSGPKLAFVMVGLPARGKTFISRKIARYLSWLGHKTQVYNVGSYRRARLGSHQHHSFFDPRNQTATEARRDVALAALDDMLAFLRRGGDIAIYDATNNTRERRAHVAERCAAEGLEVVYVESICNDPALVEANIRATKARSPDYEGVPEEEAVRDFRMRIRHYEVGYEEVREEEGRFVKIVDVGRKILLHRVEGYLLTRVVHFLLNLHVQPRTVWLTRHGESEFNVLGRIGGDSPLSEAGRAYARTLADVVRQRIGLHVAVWTSSLRRTMETADVVGLPYRAWRPLDEIDAGVCDGMTYAEIEATMPEEYTARELDKFRYRYPRGESYQDVIQRLEPVIFELEREHAPVLVVGHQAALRALYAYMMDRPPHECPFVSIPLHTIIELEPTAYGCEERRIALPPLPLDPEGFRQLG